MKLIKEGNRLILKDHNYSSYFGGLIQKMAQSGKIGFTTVTPKNKPIE